AEDGIRDATVTGVQTCALPIFRAATRRVSETENADLQRLRRSGLRDVRRHEPAAILLIRNPEFGIWNSYAFQLPNPHSKLLFSPDRKSTRLNSSHGSISYAVFC